MRAITIRGAAALTLLLPLVFSTTGAAQDGTLDITFGGDGKVTINWSGGSTSAQDVAVQADGKIVVVGHGQTAGFHVARLTPSGALDTTFDGDGLVIVAPTVTTYSSALAVAIQSDGKIVVFGGNGYDITVARLNSNGSLDATFGNAGTWMYSTGDGISAADIAIQSDGKIVLVGSRQILWYGVWWYETRLLSSGTVDTTFGNNGWASDSGPVGDYGSSASAVALQPDGKIVVAGCAGTPGGYAFAAVRLNSDGSKDTTFGPDAGSVSVDFDVVVGGDDRASAVAVQPDGKIVLGGTVEMPTATDFGAVRLTANGALDSTFKGDGTVMVPFDLGGSPGVDACTDLAVQTDGKIVLVGSVERTAAGHDDFGITRLRSDGNVDSFGLGYYAIVGFDLGGSNDDRPYGVALQADGQILVAGYAFDGSNSSDFAVARLYGSMLFSDGFESGDTSAWSSAVPWPLR